MQHCAAVRVPGAAPTPPFTLSRALEEPPDLEVSVVPVGGIGPHTKLRSSPKLFSAPSCTHQKQKKGPEPQCAYLG